MNFIHFTGYEKTRLNMDDAAKEQLGVSTIAGYTEHIFHSLCFITRDVLVVSQYTLV